MIVIIRILSRDKMEVWHFQKNRTRKEASQIMSANTNAMMGFAPALGWNSWNTFTWDINEQLIRDVADVFVKEGYRDAGYEYIVIDDCWSLKERDADGNLVVDPAKFPSGMKALADYIHDKGLKFGMYSCVGTHTCAGYPGSFEHEFQDLCAVRRVGRGLFKI